MIGESPCIIYTVAVEVAAALQSDLRVGVPLLELVRRRRDHRRGGSDAQSRIRRFADHSFADIHACSSTAILSVACCSVIERYRRTDGTGHAGSVHYRNNNNILLLHRRIVHNALIVNIVSNLLIS